MFRTALRRSLAVFASLFVASALQAQSNAVTSPRLYVFDGGVLASETARYRLTDADVEESNCRSRRSSSFIRAAC